MPDFTGEISSSLSVISSKKEITEKHFRWDSLVKFLYLMNTYSSNVHNFDFFGRVGRNDVKVFEFIAFELLLGMPYMFMDAFIKQYTRRIDGFKFLNPLLKGISFGQFLQTGFWVVLQSTFLADSARYLIMTAKTNRPWTVCPLEMLNTSCTSIHDIYHSCLYLNKTVPMGTTAAHHHYKRIFSSSDRGFVTVRCFSIGMVWLANFFVSTVSDETLLKIFFFSFVFRSVSTLVVKVMLTLSVESESDIALHALMNASTGTSWPASLIRMQAMFGLGYLGFYDFGATSPYTMVDTAVIMSTVIYTIFAFLRSWIMKILQLKLESCIGLKNTTNMHYYLFAVYPLSTELIKVHKLYTFYFYLNITITVLGYITMQTLTMSKLLHSEFRSMKNLYLVGLICCCGFAAALLLSMNHGGKVIGVVLGLNAAVLYLTFFKVAIIMYVYGVERFSTDIQFWLGFKPIRYWKFCWVSTPIVTAVIFIYQFRNLFGRRFDQKLFGFGWLLLTAIVVTTLHIKTIAKYLVRSNLASLFACNIKYGPPDPIDRKNRRNFSETMQLRLCKHNCQVIDDLIDCDHRPLLTSPTDSNSSIESMTKDIYRAEDPIPGTNVNNPSLLDLQHHHD